MAEPPRYVEVIPDGCACKWANVSDNSGWYLRAHNPNCAVHPTRVTWPCGHDHRCRSCLGPTDPITSPHPDLCEACRNEKTRSPSPWKEDQ